ncbi:MAG: hypothetical protein J5612_02325, partial [Paludibacteraceae bacterium]|nr:hypothetical protein [Paludibacteraceae bacterium]
TTYTSDPSDAKRRPEIYFRKHKDTPSKMEQTTVNETSVIKRVVNGHIVIIRDNKTYDILGKEIQ